MQPLTHTPIARKHVRNGGAATSLADDSLILRSPDDAVSIAMNMEDITFAGIRTRKPRFISLFQDNNMVGYVDHPTPQHLRWLMHWLLVPMPLPDWVTQVGETVVEV